MSLLAIIHNNSIPVPIICRSVSQNPVGKTPNQPGGVRFYPVLSPDVGKRVKMQGIIARTGEKPDVRVEFPRIS